MTEVPKIPNLTTSFVLTGSKVSVIGDTFVSNARNVSTLRSINLTNNAIKIISQKIQNMDGVQEIWLSGNPFVCDCSMTWMIPWLNRRNKHSDHNIVSDYRALICSNGKLKGVPILFLNNVLLGCYPNRWSTGQKVGVGLGLTLSILLILLTVTWKSKEMKFLLFYYVRINTVPRDDKNENLDNKEYDGFFCYW